MPDKELADLEIKLIVNIPGFGGIDLKQQGSLSDAVPAHQKILSREEVQAGVLFIHRRQILGLDEYRWIMVDGPAVLIVQPGL